MKTHHFSFAKMISLMTIMGCLLTSTIVNAQTSKKDLKNYSFEEISAEYIEPDIEIITFKSASTTNSSVNETDSLALVVLYNECGGLGWLYNDNWLTGPVSTWYGIIVENDRVIGLNLSGDWENEFGITGTLPSDLQNLNELRNLTINYGRLEGNLPVWIGTLTNLEYLNFAYNNLIGTIPNEWSSLINLNQLRIWDNNLEGSLPDWLGTSPNLTVINLGVNSFTGSIPESWVNLTNLSTLWLSGNPLDSSELPTWIGNLTLLEQLGLQNMNYYGSIPEEWSTLTSLSRFIISGNEISGEIPDWFGNLTNLDLLYLQDNQFAGAIPSSFSSLSNLEILSIYDNNISDASMLAGLTNLQRLYMGNNPIGDLTFLNSMTQLTGLEIDHLNINNVSFISNLTNLTFLNINANNLHTLEGIENCSLLLELLAYDNPLYDIRGIENLPLEYVRLYNCQISDFSPLLENPNIMDGVYLLYLENNPASREAMEVQIPALQSITTYGNWPTEEALAACYPAPGKGFVGISNSSVLEWQANFNSETGVVYNVYLGSQAYEQAIAAQSLTSNSFDPDIVENENYWWRVESILNGDTIKSGVWNFNTFPTSEVNIPDANFKIVLNEHLGYEYPETETHDPTTEELATIEDFNASNREITDITGAEYLVNCIAIDLSSNEIFTANKSANIDSPQENVLYFNDEFSNRDASYKRRIQKSNYTFKMASVKTDGGMKNTLEDLSPLAGLTQLQYLNLYNTGCSDISYLAGLTNLTDLTLWYNNISDISALTNLVKLEYLDLDENDISDISALYNLTELRVLWLSNNTISDINALLNLTSLQNLYLSNNSISDASPFSSLTNIHLLNISYNLLSDLSFVSTLNGLGHLYANGNGISDLSPVKNLNNLTRLGVSNNNISDASFLSGMTNLQTLYIGFNPISDLSFLNTMAQLTGLDVSGLNLNNLNSISNLTNLTYLNISQNNFNTFEGIENFSAINSLRANDNSLYDIRGLENLPLDNVILHANQISDFSPLINNSSIMDGAFQNFLIDNPASREAMEVQLPALNNVTYHMGWPEENPLGACYPIPSRNLGGIGIDIVLEWQANFGPETGVSYNVYFGNSEYDQPLVAEGITNMSYDPEIVEGENYWWRVEAMHEGGELIRSGVWAFNSYPVLNISDIQYTTVPGDDGTYPSLLVGQQVVTKGIVTTDSIFGSSKNFFITSNEGLAWEGVLVYHADQETQMGDEVLVSGIVAEYSGKTEIVDAQITILSSGNAIYPAIEVATNDLSNATTAEAYEGCLVKVQNLSVTQAPNQYMEFLVDDGSGSCLVDDQMFSYPAYIVGDEFDYIIGILDYSYSNHKILPRFDIDMLKKGSVLGSTLQFDGVDDYAKLDNFTYPSADFTIEAWVQPYSFGTRQEILWFFDSSTGSAIQLRINENGSIIYFENNLEISAYKYFITGQPLVLNEMNHIALVRDANDLCKIYLNGILSAEYNVNLGINATELYFGTQAGTDRFLNGLLDEVRIWSTARSENDLLANMKNYLVGDETGLEAYWRMDEGAGDVIQDLTGHGYDAQLGSVAGNDDNDPQWLSKIWPYNLPLDAKFYTVDERSGKAPLTVHFTDRSTGDIAPVSWEWDFDNDGNIDSYEQNPEWTYDHIGSYTVTLTVGDGIGHFNTETKFDFINILDDFEPEAPVNFEVDANGYATWEVPAETMLSDDFESYDVGSFIAAQSDIWQTWADDPNVDAPISDDQALSGTKSIKFEGEGTSDVLFYFDNLTQGHFELKLNIFVVAGNGAYYNMLHSYTDAGIEFALEVTFAADGTANFRTNAIITPFSYTQDAWNECKIDINLDTDWAIYYVNGTQIYEWQWSKTATGADGLNQLAALDIYSYAANGENPLYYIDDVSIEFLYDLTGYNVYLDGDNVGTTTDLFWQYTELNPGTTYQAGVSAVYGDAQFESEIVEQGFEATAENNVGILSLSLPEIPWPSRSLCGSTNDEEISIWVYNNGINPMSGFELGYSIDEGSPVIEIFAGTLLPGDTLDYVFSTNADLFTEEYKRTFFFNAFINTEDSNLEDNDYLITFNVFGEYTDIGDWTTYNSCDGMISDISFAIAEDKNGNIWSTDFYGASKFDGANWTTYTSEDGLGENYNWAILNDKEGNIWFSGSSGNVLTKYDGTSFINYNVEGTFEECIYEDTQGNIWFGSFGGFGIVRYDGSNWIYYSHNNGISGQQVLSIGEDVHGNIYASTDAGLNIFDGTNWTSFSISEFMGSYIPEIYYDKIGNTWFATYSDGIFKYDGANWTHYTVDDGALVNCEDITEDIYGNIWFGGGNEIVKFDGVSWIRYSVEDGLVAASAGNIYAIYADSKGDIWTGTYRGGISKLEQTPSQSVDWTVNPSNFAYDGEVMATVFFDDIPASSGVLGAFINGECRGVISEPQLSPNNDLVYALRIYSNNVSGDDISFKFFDADMFNSSTSSSIDSCIFQIQEHIIFEVDMVIGTAMVPFEMNVYSYFGFNKAMTAGWNWFSVYVENENMQLDSILSSLNPQAGDYIKDRKGTGNSATFYDEDGWKGWFGTLAEIDPIETYKMNLTNPGDIIYNGFYVNLADTEIPVNAGWNWIGYPVSFEMGVANYLATLNIVDTDYIKNQTKSSTFDNEWGWFGTLETMLSGDGYVLRVANAGSIHSLDTISNKAVSFKNKPEIDIPKYDVKVSDFEFSGSAIIEVFNDDFNIGAENNILYAFNKEDVCVGIINGLHYPMTDKYLYNLMIYSNIEDGDEVHFKFFEREKNQWYSFEESMSLAADMIVADAYYPFELKNAIAENLNDDISGIELYPNPVNNILYINFNLDKTQNVKIAVYDHLGKMIELIVDKTSYSSGTHHLEWNTSDIPAGIYYIRIEKQERVENLKVLKIK